MAMFQFQNPFAAVIVIMCISLSFYSSAMGEQGIASFYTPPYVPSACYGFQEQGTTMFAAVREEMYAGGAACGKLFKVTCTGGTNLGTPQPCYGTSVTVKIVELCPSCAGSGRDFDLSQEAFAAIANTDSGLININYEQV